MGGSLKGLRCLECNTGGLIRKESVLTCEGCLARYPIKEGVYHLFRRGRQHLFDEFRPRGHYKIGKGDAPLDSSQFWGFVWGRVTHNREDLEKIVYFSEESFLRTIPLKKSEYRDKRVLILGCGNGREINLILRYHPKQIVAVDISSSVYDVKKAFGPDERVVIIRSDILDLPFERHTFDIIIAERVLHHLRGWRDALRKVYPLLRKNGVISFSVYSKEDNGFMMHVVEPAKGALHRHLNLKQMYALSFIIAIPLYLSVKFHEMIEKTGLELSLHRNFKFWRGFGFEFLWKATVFDLLSSPVAHYISKEELLDISKGIGANEISIMGGRGTAVWSVRAASSR